MGRKGNISGVDLPAHWREKGLTKSSTSVPVAAAQVDMALSSEVRTQVMEQVWWGDAGILQNRKSLSCLYDNQVEMFSGELERTCFH